jgi:hypothetical protein
MDTVFAFKLGYFEIYCHRLPSFLPLTGDIIRLPEQLFSDGRQTRPTGEGMKRREVQCRQPNLRYANINNAIFTGTPHKFSMPLHVKLISNSNATIGYAYQF